MVAGIFALIAAFWFLVTPFRLEPGAAPAGMSAPEMDPTRTLILSVAVGLVGLLSLGLAVAYGPRLLRQLHAALTSPPAPPEKPRRALVTHFLFALLLAYFVEGGIGAALAPRPALVVDGAAYRLSPSGVSLRSDAGERALRRTEGGWRASDPKVAERLEQIELPGLAHPATLSWEFGSARLTGSGEVKLTVDGIIHTLEDGAPLELRPGSVLILGELRATVTGPTWRLLVILTAVGKSLALLAVVGLLFALGGRDLLAEVGWVRRGWSAEVRRGLAALLGFLPVYVSLVVVTLLLGTYFEIPIESHPLIKAVMAEGGVLLPFLVGLGAVVIAPLQEELLFRGLFQQSAQRAVGRLGALLVTGVAFGLIHQGFASLLPLSGLGILFGVLRLTSPNRSLVSSTVAHALFNGLTLTLLIAATA